MTRKPLLNKTLHSYHTMGNFNKVDDENEQNSPLINLAIISLISKAEGRRSGLTFTHSVTSCLSDVSSIQSI